VASNIDIAISYLKSALSFTLHKPSTGSLLYHHLGRNLFSNNIEDELTTAFARLDGQLVNRHDNPDPTIPTVLGIRLDYYAEPYIVPSVFYDIGTARRYLEHIQYRSRPNVKRSDQMQLSMSSSDEVTLFKEETRRVVSLQEMEVLRSQLGLWFRAFGPLYENIVSGGKSKSYIAAKTLGCQGLQTYLLLYGPLKPNQSALPSAPLSCLTWAPEGEELDSVCAEMLFLCKVVITDNAFTTGFMFSLRLVPSLLVVILSAEKREVEWEAVRVLRSIGGGGRELGIARGCGDGGGDFEG